MSAAGRSQRTTPGRATKRRAPLGRPAPDARRGIEGLQQTAGNHALDALLQARAQDVPRVVDQAGTALPPALRIDMEARFDADFGDVQVHHDANARQSATGLAAKAYTVGSHIVFGENRYQPATPDGKRLIAHELAHVVQQRRGGPPPAVGHTDSAIEHGAEQASNAVVASAGPVAVAGASGVGVARDDDPVLTKALEQLAAADSARCAPSHHQSAAPPFAWNNSLFDEPPPAPSGPGYEHAHVTPPGVAAPGTQKAAPRQPKKNATPPPWAVDFLEGKHADTEPPQPAYTLIPGGPTTLEEAAMDRPTLERKRREDHRLLRQLAPSVADALLKNDPHLAKSMGQYAEADQPPPVVPEASAGVNAPMVFRLESHGRPLKIDNPAYWQTPRGRARRELGEEIKAARNALERLYGERRDIVDSSIVIRRTAEGMVGVKPPPLSALNRCFNLLKEGEEALDLDNVEGAARLHAEALRVYREANWYWARYKEFLMIGGERTIESLEMVKDTAKYSLIVMSMGSGTAVFAVGTAGTIAIDAAENAGKAALGEKVNWEQFGVDVVVQVLLARFGGKASQGVLSKLAAHPALAGVEKSVIANALANGVLARSVETTVASMRGQDMTWEQAAERVFDPKSIAFDLLVAGVQKNLKPKASTGAGPDHAAPHAPVKPAAKPPAPAAAPTPQESFLSKTGRYAAGLAFSATGIGGGGFMPMPRRRPPLPRVATQVAPEARAKAVHDVSKRMGSSTGTSTMKDVYTANEIYAESLVRQGALPQLGKPDLVIPGNLPAGKAPPNSGKDLWIFKNQQPVSMELKYTEQAELTKLGVRRTDLHGNVSRDERRWTTQATPRGDRNDWLTWLGNNRAQAEALVKKGQLDARWLDEHWVKQNAQAHFQRKGNRYLVVVSKSGKADLNPAVRDAAKLPPEQVILLATPH